jgi:hypothetical protein
MLLSLLFDRCQWDISRVDNVASGSGWRLLICWKLRTLLLAVSGRWLLLLSQLWF